MQTLADDKAGENGIEENGKSGQIEKPFYKVFLKKTVNSD